MAIHKKNGKYVPIVYMGKDPLTGKEIRKWGHYWDKERDAKKEEAAMILEKDKPKSATIFKDSTFDALFSQYVDMVVPVKYADSTKDMYMGYYHKHIEPIFKNKLLKDIEPLHIQRFMQSKGELAPASQRKIFYFLKSIFDSGVKWNWIKTNPCLGTELPSIKKDKNKEFWLPHQISEFFKSNVILESKYYVMFLVSFSTGMRPGEVCGLKWEDITADCITVTTGIDKKKRATDLKNSSSHRKIYIDRKLYLKLVLQQKWQKENMLLFGDKYTPSDYVFTHEDGSIIGPYRYSVAFKNLLEQTELDSPKISIYDARHSFASNAISSGIEPSVVAEILGHSTISTTYDNYVHVKPEPIRKASEVMYNIISR